MLFCFKEAFITRILLETKDNHTAAWLLSQSDDTLRFSPLVIQQTLREGCFRSHADGMAVLPVLIPSKGGVEFGIIFEFFRFQSQY